MYSKIYDLKSIAELAVNQNILIEMFSPEEIKSLFSLDKLSAFDRKLEERALTSLIDKKLNNPFITVDEWFALLKLSENFKDEYSSFLIKLFERAPTEDLAENLLKNIPIKYKDDAMDGRSIWLKILELENLNPSGDKLTAIEAWSKISCLFFSPNKTGLKVSGLSLKPNFWREAFNSGQKGNESWFDVWLQCKCSLSFVEWSKALGINFCVAYYNDEERQSLKVNIKDGKLYDRAEIPIDTMNIRYDCVMALDETLYSYATSTLIKKEGFYHHSGILSGKPVIFAGELICKNGIIMKITTRSGHYQPSEKNLRNFLSVLEKNGINLQNLCLEDDSGRTISTNAKTYIKPESEENYSDDFSFENRYI
ncbi:MAG: hypothetical protein H0U73_05325 [Tatlockia sp.]|nr:hypothetical protein [Tatlockia sp.]